MPKFTFLTAGINTNFNCPTVSISSAIVSRELETTKPWPPPPLAPYQVAYGLNLPRMIGAVDGGYHGECGDTFIDAREGVYGE